MKYTKGEWFISRGVEIISMPSQSKVAKICGMESLEEMTANANLIATAPEMLEALQSVNRYFIDLQNKCALANSDERAWQKVSKAIKKATE